MVLKGYGSVKPPPGTIVNPDHPLFDSMVGGWSFNDRGGLSATNIVGAEIGQLVNTSGYGTALGRECINLGAGGVGGGRVSTGIKVALTDFTFVGRFLQTGTASNSERVVDCKYDTGFCINRSGTSANTWDGYIRATNFGAVTATDGIWHDVAILRRAAVGQLWIDGKLAATSAPATTALQTTFEFRLGTDENGNAGLAGYIEFGYYYRKALSPNDILWIKNEPYDMFIKEPRRYYSLPSSSTVYSRYFYDLLPMHTGSPF